MPGPGQKKCAECGDYAYKASMIRTGKGLLCPDCAEKPVSEIPGLDPIEAPDDIL